MFVRHRAARGAAVEVLVTAVLVLVAYLAGLVSFKVKSRWCPVCGAVKSCPTCTRWRSPWTTNPAPHAGDRLLADAAKVLRRHASRPGRLVPGCFELWGRLVSVDQYTQVQTRPGRRRSQRRG